MIIRPKKNPRKLEFCLESGESLYIFPVLPSKSGLLWTKTFYEKKEGMDDLLRAKRRDGTVLREEKN